jgi:glutathione S-transferase
LCIRDAHHTAQDARIRKKIVQELENMGIVLKYFPIMGAAERVRLALWLGEIEFEDVRIPPVDWPELKGQTPFGQLPIMSIEGGAYIAQSNAMLQYIGTLAPKLCPADQFLKVQEAIGLVDDFERAFRPCVGLALEPEKYGYGITPATVSFTKGSSELLETIKALRETFLVNEMPKYCGFFSDLIESSGGPFLCGAEPTLADCCLAPVLERYTLGYIDHVPMESLDAYSTMKLYLEFFKALPQVVAYEQSKS